MFIEGYQTVRRLTNFFVFLLLATVIATFGVLSNSTATVIGAMIVAPLMGSRRDRRLYGGWVAIAISLVPPLCVVGIAQSQREWGAVGGELLSQA